ncbi:MAG: hypothetical protein KDA51_04270, partial [Planctomycetales bacterium]|nr:hypothetical protein [Planctomycetales bacterium]
INPHAQYQAKPPLTKLLEDYIYEVLHNCQTPRRTQEYYCNTYQQLQICFPNFHRKTDDAAGVDGCRNDVSGER